MDVVTAIIAHPARLGDTKRAESATITGMENITLDFHAPFSPDQCEERLRRKARRQGFFALTPELFVATSELPDGVGFVAELRRFVWLSAGARGVVADAGDGSYVTAIVPPMPLALALGKALVSALPLALLAAVPCAFVALTLLVNTAAPVSGIVMIALDDVFWLALLLDAGVWLLLTAALTFAGLRLPRLLARAVYHALSDPLPDLPAFNAVDGEGEGLMFNTSAKDKRA